MKKKSITRRLIVAAIWLLLIAALAVLFWLIYAPQSPLNNKTTSYPKAHVDYFEEVTDKATGKAVALKNGKVVLDNGSLKFEMDPTTTQFTVTDKNGRVWASNPADADKDPVATSQVNKAILKSTVVVSYTGSAGTIDKNNWANSIEQGAYTISVDEETNTVSVRYAIGTIQKVYKIPLAISEERYKLFTNEMSKSTKKKVEGYYTKVTPEKATAEQLALYPSLADTTLFLFKENTNPSQNASNKLKAEGFWAEAGYSDEDFELDQSLIAGAVKTANDIMNVTINYRLDGDDFVVEVPYSEIACNEEYPITYLSVLPLFGAAGTQDEGFMLVPEGGGGIINYNNGKLSQSNYYANLYGWDFATRRTEGSTETRIEYPVFGMTREGGSFICMIEGGASYAGINADIAIRGNNNSYNYAYAKYNVLHADKYNVSAKTEKLVYMFEQQLPSDTVVQRYRFLDSDNYVDMANAYGEYLSAAYPEMQPASVSEETPVAVNVVGAINKIEVKAGLPIDSVVSTTSFTQAGEIISDLLSKGVKNMSVRYTGWANGGIYQKVLTGVNVLGELGGVSKMKTLIASAKDQGVDLYFDGVSCFAYNSGLMEGFVSTTNAAKYTTREEIKLVPFSLITILEDDSQDPYFLVKPSFASKCASNLIKKLNEFGAAGIAFRDIGYLLSGDCNPKDFVTREQVKAQNIATMKEAIAANEKIMILRGNDYAVPYADIVIDMDLEGTEYLLIDKFVPFYQIALHGMKNYTGTSINLAGDYKRDILVNAEYGAGLSFTFMAEDTTVLQGSEYCEYYGARYTDWAEEAVEIINRYQADMAGLNKLRITGHEYITEDVHVTTYENGTKVYVNYGTLDYQADGVKVGTLDYTVVKGGK